jgi:hypothetical protein
MTDTPWHAALAVQNNGPNYWTVGPRKWGAPSAAHCAKEEDAVRIVKAVNCHENLLTGIKASLAWLSMGLTGRDGEYSVDLAMTAIRNSAILLEEALKQAEEQP